MKGAGTHLGVQCAGEAAIKLPFAMRGTQALTCRVMAGWHRGRQPGIRRECALELTVESSASRWKRETTLIPARVDSFYQQKELIVEQKRGAREQNVSAERTREDRGMSRVSDPQSSFSWPMGRWRRG